MEFLGLLLVVAIAWYVLSNAYQGYKSGAAGDNGQKHCMTCGTDAVPVTETRGSLMIEIVLWLCFIVPGLIYSLWRLTTKREICPACRANALVPYQSPAAVQHRKTLNG